MNNKTLFTTLIIISSCIVSQAQGLYFGIKAGYSLGFAGEGVATNQTNFQYYFIDRADVYSVYPYTNSISQGSYGQGFTPALQIGYMFSKYVGAELGVGYLIGKKFEKSYSTNPYYSSDSILITNTNTAKTGATSFFINPSLVIRLPNESKFVPYVKMGIYIGVLNKLNSDLSYSNNYYPSNSIVENVKYSKGNINLGFTAALGADYMVTKNVGLFAEFNVVAANISLKETFEGQSLISIYGTNKTNTSITHTTTEYSDHVTYNDSQNQYSSTPITGPGIESGSTSHYTTTDGRTGTSTYIEYTDGHTYSTTDQTVKSLSSYVPLSSIGISIGARYYFGK